MERILCIVGSMDVGGAETFLMKVYRKIDRSKYQMDFCVATHEKCFYEDEIKSLGGKIYRISPKTKGILRNFIEIKEIVKNGEYNSVLRISQNSLSALELLAAKLGGAKKLIFRSSNSNTCGNKKSVIVHKLFRWMTITIPNIKIAPSTEAAEFMFGKKMVEKNKVIIVNNGLDIDLFKYDLIKRDKKREELGIQNKFVIGHIGRFNTQKNHKYLIEIFSKVYQERKDAILLLIGIGELQEEIRSLVKSLKLENNVLFLGIRKDIPELLMAMDIFVFPSLYEGMPNTVVEAQATGLKCLVSNTITKEVKIINSLEFMEITPEKLFKWKDTIIRYNKKNNRNTDQKAFENKGYTITQVVENFEKIVF